MSPTAVANDNSCTSGTPPGKANLIQLKEANSKPIDPGSAHGSVHSLSSAFSEKMSINSFDKGHGGSSMSGSMRRDASFLEGTAAISDSMSILSDDSSSRLSPLGIVVKKCARELQSHPPLSERRSLLILQSLYNVISNNDQSKPVAIENGALPAITSVMKTYKDSAKLQSRAILILGCMGENNFDHQEAIAGNHGVSYILSAMTNHPKSGSLSLEACSALYKLTSQSPRNASQLAHSDGIRTLRSSMQAHIKDQGIQQYALAVLCKVAESELTEVEDPELIEVVVDVMGKHKKVKTILQVGNTLLHVLSVKGTPRTKNSLVWSNAVPVILKSLKYNPSTGSTQLEGCESLYALSLERPEARVTIAEDGVNLIFEAMHCHPTSGRIQKAACLVLLLLVEDHTSTYVVKAMKKSPKYRGVLESAHHNHNEECGALASKILLVC